MRPFLLVLLVGCSVQSGEANHPSAPQVVSLGGDVLASPKVVPIFFSGDSAMQAQVEQFLGVLAASDYWGETTSEYGVGPLTVAPTIVTSDAPPTSDDTLDAWLATKIGTPDPQAIYSVFLPPGVAFQSNDGVVCQDFGGYHYETASAQGAPLVLALIPRCGTGDELYAITESVSHELIEAATDPHVVTGPAFYDVDADHEVWAFMPGAELGDMCEYLDSSYGRYIDSYNYVVPRAWSNAAAAAGHDPCVPGAPDLAAYHGVAAVLPDTASIVGATSAVTTKAVHIPVGASKTIEVDLFADGDTAPWSVEAQDVAQVNGGPAELAFQWDRTSGTNGDKLHLTITALRASSAARSELVLYSIIDGKAVAMSAAYVAN